MDDMSSSMACTSLCGTQRPTTPKGAFEPGCAIDATGACAAGLLRTGAHAMGARASMEKDQAIGYKRINARAEGIADKPSFKRPLRAQRCLLARLAVFEWQGERGHKTKYRIVRKDGKMFGLAGLYDVRKRPDGDELITCTIITCTPNTAMAPIRTRMTVILR